MLNRPTTGIMYAGSWIDDLPPAARLEMHDRMVTRDLAAGEVLQAAGAPPVGLHQLERGHLKLVGLLPDGRQTLIVIYRPGNSLSESTVVSRRPFRHTTLALTDARVRFLPSADFWELYHRHSAIPEALCRKFEGVAGRLLERRELTATHRLREMLAVVFEALAKHCGRLEPDGSATIDLPLTQNDLADHLAVTRQAVQRELGRLGRAGLVSKVGGRWRIHSPAGLAGLIERSVPYS